MHKQNDLHTNELNLYSPFTVVLRKKILTDRRATVPPIVNTVYLLRRKSCARFLVYFSDFLPELHKTSVSKYSLDPYQQSTWFTSQMFLISLRKSEVWKKFALATEISDFGYVIKGNNSNRDFTCLQYDRAYVNVLCDFSRYRKKWKMTSLFTCCSCFFRHLAKDSLKLYTHFHLILLL